MGKKIFKYPILVGAPNQIEVPIGSNFRHFQEQDGVMCIWVEIDETKTRKETWALAIFGTGHTIPDNCQYMSTAQAGPFMWHLYRDFGA